MALTITFIKLFLVLNNATLSNAIENNVRGPAGSTCEELEKDIIIHERSSNKIDLNDFRYHSKSHFTPPGFTIDDVFEIRSVQNHHNSNINYTILFKLNN